MNSKNKINNLIEYNKSQKLNKNFLDKELDLSESSKISKNSTNTTNNIITNNGYKCIAPCFDKNTLYYHPITFQGILEKNFPSCPVYDFNNQKDEVILYDKCNIKDNTNINTKKYNIFDDNIEFAITSNNFLIEVYNIKNIIDVINFLNNSIEELPIYTQKRLLVYIYNIYSNYDDFPLESFSNITINIFNKIYKIKLDIIKITNKIKKIKNKNNNIFDYLLNKYSK
jgi:hypothetical protein